MDERRLPPSADFGEFVRCPKCREYGLSNRHVCAPAHLCWVPEWGETDEDARTVYARTPKEAAEKLAELISDGEPWDDGRVCVSRDGVTRVFAVNAEVTVVYHTREIKNKEENE